MWQKTSADKGGENILVGWITMRGAGDSDHRGEVRAYIEVAERWIILQRVRSGPRKTRPKTGNNGRLGTESGRQCAVLTSAAIVGNKRRPRKQRVKHASWPRGILDNNLRTGDARGMGRLGVGQKLRVGRAGQDAWGLCGGITAEEVVEAPGAGQLGGRLPGRERSTPGSVWRQGTAGGTRGTLLR
jgi:hypothetical protein